MRFSTPDQAVTLDLFKKRVRLSLGVEDSMAKLRIYKISSVICGAFINRYGRYLAGGLSEEILQAERHTLLLWSKQQRRLSDCLRMAASTLG